MIRMLGAIVDASKQAVQLIGTFEARLAEARTRPDRLPEWPKVFFEEWDNSLISAIGWVSELVKISGGVDILADRTIHHSARERIVSASDHRVLVCQEVQAGAWPQGPGSPRLLFGSFRARPVFPHHVQSALV